MKRSNNNCTQAAPESVSGCSPMHVNTSAKPSQGFLTKKFNESIANEFLTNIDTPPQELLHLISTHCQPSLQALLQQSPELGARTLTDTLTSAKLKLQPFTDLSAATQKLLEVINLLENNFRADLDQNLHRGHTLADGLIHSLAKLLKAPNLAPVAKIANVYKDDGLDDAAAQRVVNAFLAVTQLVPLKYQTNVPPLSLIIRQDSGAAFAAPGKHSALVLNIKSDLFVQMAEAFHEYLHLIEQYNPAVLAASQTLLSQRQIATSAQTLGDLGRRYQKRVVDSAQDLSVLPTDFIDLYTGRVYDQGLTEVLSVGGEALILSPTNFYIRDPEHFQLLQQLILGQL